MSRRINALGRQRVRPLLGMFSFVFLAAAIALAGLSPAQANPRYAAYVVDVQGGQVLFSRYAGETRYPASLTKMMTLYMLFEQLQAGRMNLNDRITMTRHAASMPPTKIGLRPGQSMSVEDAIKSLITRSANDVAAAIGDNLAGSEAEFARRMTAKARALGMSSTTFRNASGLPDRGQTTTARDMALLGIALSQHFPDYYKYFSTRNFSFNGQQIRNHNRLLGSMTGVDGIKTGYIRSSGFNLVSSVRRDGRHVVAVVMGGRTAATRDAHMRDLIAQHLPKAQPRPTTPVVVARTAPDPSPGIQQQQSPVQQAAAQTAVAAPRTSEPPPAPVTRPQAIADAHAVVAAMAASQPPLLEQGSSDSAVSAYAPETDPGEAAAAAVGGGWLVQIAAVAREGDAVSMLNEAKGRVGKALDSAAPVTERIERNGTTLYRARFTGFDRSSAQAACEALQRNNYACFPIKN